MGRIRTTRSASRRGDAARRDLLGKLGEETFALLGRGTLPIPTALRATYDALVALGGVASVTSSKGS